MIRIKMAFPAFVLLCTLSMSSAGQTFVETPGAPVVPRVAQSQPPSPTESSVIVVKPGLTGWAQVRYTYGATVEDAIEKLQYDLFYIKNLSIKLDLFIVFETIKTVLLRRGQ